MNSALGARPVPIEAELDERQRGVAVGQAVVELERLERRGARLIDQAGDRRRPRKLTAISEQQSASPAYASAYLRIFGDRALEERPRLLAARRRCARS